jgi:hypothetical protein
MRQIPEQPRGEHQMRPGRRTLLFSDFRETHPRTEADLREWFVSPSTSGWRLEFMDPGDLEPTYAGTFASIAAAKQEARR